MRRYVSFVCFMVIVSMLSACGAKDVPVQAVAADSTSIKATIINTKGKKIGTAELSPVAEGVNIHLVAANLPPGVHGFHIHEVGLCEKPDFVSSGMHLNPLGKEHGFDNPKGYHAGDLPNIQVGTDGKVNVDLIANTVTLEKGKSNSILTAQGVSLIIHEKSDDYMTDPSGNSGARIACGVIK
jgi:Cu-Zn family superoxide dismutase